MICFDIKNPKQIFIFSFYFHFPFCLFFFFVKWFFIQLYFRSRYHHSEIVCFILCSCLFFIHLMFVGKIYLFFMLYELLIRKINFYILIIKTRLFSGFLLNILRIMMDYIFSTTAYHVDSWSFLSQQYQVLIVAN